MPKLREARDHRLGLQPGFMRHDRSAGDDLIRLEVPIHSCPGRNHDLIPDVDVVGKTGLSSDHHVTTDRGASGDPDLRDDNGVLADRDVVRDLDEIVDFRAVFDDCVAESRAIDRHIGAQLNVILNDHTAKLRNFVMRALVLYVAEAVTADDRPAMNGHTGADPAPFANDHVGIEYRVITDCRIISHKDSGIESDERADPDSVTEGDAWPDRGIGADLHLSSSICAGRNATRRDGRAKECLSDTSECEQRVGENDVWAAQFRQSTMSEQCAGLDRDAGLEVTVCRDK